MNSISTGLTCPRCGPQYPLVRAGDIGLEPPDQLICSMNMPFQGCGYRHGIPAKTPTKGVVVSEVPVEWSLKVECACGRRMHANKGAHYGCKCGNRIHMDEVERLRRSKRRGHATY